MSQQFMEPPMRIAMLPKPAVYRHPSYGSIKIDRERNARFVQNFKDGVYQSRLPIDAEHQTKLSGAIGWITDLTQLSDGSVDATVEWTDRGASMLSEDRFAYVSPEWFDAWIDPATGKSHQDILIGAALTTRPFFKEGSLRPLVASERSISIQVDGGTTADFVAEEEGMDPKENPAAVDPSQFAEMQSEVKRLSEENAAYKAAGETAQATAKALSEKVATMERDARRKRFTDEVMGRGESSGTRWFGEPEKHVSVLEALADANGEDSEVVRQYIETQRAAGEAIAKGGLFSELGSNGSGKSGGGQAKVDGLVKALRERDPKLTPEQAELQVYSEHPELYDEYEREHPVQRGEA